MNAPASRPVPLLVADMGGTNCRFAVVRPGGRPVDVQAMANAEFDGPAAAIAHFLAQNAGERPERGVLAVAGPILGDEVALTNRSWRFRVGELSRELGIRLSVINDFEAVAWAIPALRPGDVRPVGPHEVPGEGAKVVCGPGTGLGAAALMATHEGPRVMTGEGGHVSFGPAQADEDAVFSRLREAAGPVSAETVLSGPGLARLHRALHPGCAAWGSEAIVAGARDGDQAAAATVALFVRLLGRFAGDLALTFKATGGVYLAGGLGSGLGPLLDAEAFRRAFERHPPYEALLAAIPVFAITHPQPGLLGCAAYAERFAR